MSVLIEVNRRVRRMLLIVMDLLLDFATLGEYRIVEVRDEND